jgi:hypothetical protein
VRLAHLSLAAADPDGYKVEAFWSK